MKKEKFITIGEIMLRLTPPDYEKIRTTNMFEARYGGSEANVALSLANLGIDASFFTVVPDNSLGKSAIRMLRSNDVDCSSVKFTTEEETPTHRLGTYYLETGYGIRPSKVIYDRKNSAFAEYDFAQTDLDAILEGHTWLHLSGITPALGKSCKEMILACLKLAKEKGIPRSMAAVELAMKDEGRKIFVLGNAPTALYKVIEMFNEGCSVDAVVGFPVGFVGAAESKYSLEQTEIPYIVAEGRKGGSNVAAAIVNAILYAM